MRSSNGRNLKTPALRISVDEKCFENEGFQKRWLYYNHYIPLSVFFSNTNTKLSVIGAFFKFLRLSVHENHLMYFQSETFIFKFLWQSGLVEMTGFSGFETSHWFNIFSQELVAKLLETVEFDSAEFYSSKFFFHIFMFFYSIMQVSLKSVSSCSLCVKKMHYYYYCW